MATQSNTSISQDLLDRAHPPDIAAQIHQKHITQRPLLLRPSSPDARSKRQQARLKKQHAQRRSKKPKPLSAAQKRKLNLYEIPKEQQKYAIYEPVHQLWCAYMREILQLKGKERPEGRTYVDAAGAGPVLVSAEYVGAKMEVVRSRCGSLVGLSGIVVKDGKFAFEIVTVKDRVKCVPKRGNVFRFAVPFEEDEGGTDDAQKKEARKPLEFEIHGTQFEARAPDRANRKFRWHYDPEL